MKKLTFLIALLCCFTFSNGQSNKRLKEFSKDFSTYIDELNTFMSTGSPSEYRKKMLKVFSKKWKGSDFSSSNKEVIIDISNKMLKSRKRQVHFEGFLNAILAFNKHESFKVQFNNWSQIIQFYIENEPTSRLQKLFAYTDDLFDEQVLFKNRSLYWQTSLTSFRFSIEDSTACMTFTQPLDLICIARGDTMKITNTQGVYYPMKSVWKGQNGLVDWKKAGYSMTEVYAELSDYSIKLKTPNYKADSVRFYNEMIFGEEAIYGNLEDKLVNRNKEDERVNYPKFNSYKKDIILSDLIEDVDFQGGYSLHGNRFVSTGGDGKLASLIFYRNGKQFIRVSSQRIASVGSRVLGSDASVKIFFENDSIIHPGLNLIYDLENRRLDLISDDEGISSSPYVNTYHNLEMRFEKLEWYIDNDEMVFGNLMGSNSKPAFFESSSFFTKNKFDKMIGIDANHPLVIINEFNQKYGINNTFLIEDFLNLSKFSDDQDIRFLMNLTRQGFLNYNSALGHVRVKDNVERYIMAKSEKIDHDVIILKSSQAENNANAILDLTSMDLDIFNVENIRVSEERAVLAIPSDRKVTVKEGLNFNLSGKLIAGSGGRFRIKSNDITFNYEDFRMYFKDGSTEIWIPNNQDKRDEKGNLILEPLQSEITISNGELLVDTNINKSGIWNEDYPQYPIIRSYNRSKVFYDQEDIFSGVYSRDRFYFDIDPFEIDSLDSYNRTSLSFPGELNSADIFPNFRQELRVQADNCLGFEITIPEGGYPLYVDKGEFLSTNTLTLNKSGLRGSGDFIYLSSKTNSDDYLFFPDSMNTFAKTFELSRTSGEGGVPQASGNTIYEHWLPYDEVLTIRKQAEDLVLYGAKATLDGECYLTPMGLSGAGIVALEDSELFSNLYYFNLNEFNADTADFILNRSDDLEAIAFESVNLQTKINLVDRTGTFQSNGTGSFVSFPENQYICYIDELKWFMDKSLVELGVSSGGAGSRFVSVHPEQDSLSFVSRKASYSLIDYIIQAQEVDEILVADAAIYPGDGAVTVETGSIMRTLNNASLLINTEERYHELFDASINIQGGKSYTGVASVNYQGRGIDTQVIRFDTLFIDSTLQSVGYGEIFPERGFQFNPQFAYKGKVIMEGSMKDFLYDGAFQVKHECYLVNDGWVRFNDYVGMDEIKLPIGDSLFNEDGRNLYVGPIMSDERMYPAFLSLLENETDIVMMPIKGYLSYNNSKSQFIVENEDSQSRFTMNNSGCIMKGDGEFNLGIDLGRVDIKTTGSFNYNAVENTFKSTCMFSLDFYMSSKAMDFMGEELYNDPMADELEMRESYYIPNFNRLLGDEDLTFEYEMYGLFEKLPKQLKKTLNFYEVNFEWDSESSSLMSKKMLGLGNINNYQINKLYKGRIELNNDISGDILNLYLETDIGEWYYFNYFNDIMLSRSSMDEYNIQIMEVKTQQKKLPTVNGKAPYQYDLSSETDVDNFKKRFFR